MVALTPQIFYRDPKAALAWLERAFGFEITMVVTDDAGNLGHAEMAWRGAPMSIGAELESPEIIGPARMRSPASLEGQGTQFTRVEIEGDMAAHCARATAAGARITQEPADQFYGQRTYRALDLEGHVWTFFQDVEVSDEVKARGGALTIRTKLND
ncbi:MAG TPA: VOC family protein [Caulobacteraceae bacterium]